MKNLMLHQVAVALSLTFVERNEDNTSRYFTLPLCYITGAFLVLWQVWPIALKLIHCAIFTGKVLAIAFNSACYGMGLQYV